MADGTRSPGDRPLPAAPNSSSSGSSARSEGALVEEVVLELQHLAGSSPGRKLDSLPSDLRDELIDLAGSSIGAPIRPALERLRQVEVASPPEPHPSPDPAAQAVPVPAPAALPAPTPTSRPALLLVAAPTIGREFLARLLIDRGFAVESADNTWDAERAISRNSFALLLVDPEVVAPAERGRWPRGQGNGPKRVWLEASRSSEIEDAEPSRNTLSFPPSETELERFLGSWKTQ